MSFSFSLRLVLFCFVLVCRLVTVLVSGEAVGSDDGVRRREITTETDTEGTETKP